MTRGFDYEKYNNDKNERKLNKRKVLTMIIIIIIIILLLITSCSCTSGFFGRIGNPFGNEGEHTVEPDTNDKEIIRNKYLKFDSDNVEMSLSDLNYKLSYSYEYIIPKSLTCTTSDATIATCYVENGYVVINPKSEGTVTITLSGEANDKKYEATATVTITNSKRYIQLSDEKGTIDLRKSSIKRITFDLIGLDGEVKVSSSNEKVARVHLSKEGVITITGKAVGTSDIIVTLEYNGKVYEAIYRLTVINGAQGPSVKPGDPNQPNEPSGEIKSSDSSLRVLKPNHGSIDFNSTTYNYTMGFSWWRWHLGFTAIPNSDKATVQYFYNGNVVDDLDRLKLNVGENIVRIVVTAEDGSTSIYEVVVNRAQSSNNYLKKLETSVGQLTPSFDKQKLHYELLVGNSVEKLTLNAVPYRKKSTVYYTFNGQSVGSLNDLQLNVGVNTVTITVVAPDGKSVRIYDVKIIREKASSELDGDNTLKTLNVSKGDPLHFDPMNNGPYYVNVGAGVSDVAVTAIPNSDKIKDITYTFNGQKIDSLDSLNLKSGDNKLEITVTAEDGSKRTYVVIINKAAKDNSNTLMMIITNKGTLTPAFDSNHSHYKVYVKESDQFITLTATTTDKNATLSYIYNNNKVNSLTDLRLEEGTNTVQILVTSASGVGRTYIVDIIKPVSPKSNNNYLEKIETEPNLNITFDKETKDPIRVSVKSDVDKINLKGIPEDKEHAQVKYIVGNEVFDHLNDLPLQLGDNEIIIRVTAEDGSTRDYQVIINRSDLSLESLKDSYKKLDALFKKDQLTYQIELDSSKDKISIYPEFKKDLNVTFKVCKVVDGEEKDCQSRTDLNDVPLDYGTNRVFITLEKNNESKSYVVDVYRTPLSTENRLDSIEVKDDSSLTLKPEFHPDLNDYTLTVPYDKKEITLEVTKKDPNSKVTVEYEYNGVKYDRLEDLPLKEGKNDIKIIVTSESGEDNVYTVHVHRPTRVIEFERTSYDLPIGKNHTLPYKIYEIDSDGNREDVTEKVSYKEVEALFEDSLLSEVAVIENGWIQIKPDAQDLDKETSLKVSYDGKEATVQIRFTQEDYYVSSPSLDYQMSLSSSDLVNNVKEITLNTNLFSKLVTKEINGNALILKSDQDKYIKIEIVSGSELVTLDYKETNEMGPNSLALLVTALKEGTVKFKVTMGAYGNVLTEPNQSLDITLTIVKKKVLVLDGNGGIYNLLTNRYTFLIGENESVDLSEYVVPYKESDVPCQVYKFLGYSQNKESKVADQGLEVQEIDNQKVVSYIVKDLEKDLTLYAIYSEELEEKEPEKKELWLVDIPLFHNEEYFSKYNEDKVIYPGAKGYYTEKIKNETDKTITITNLILKEDTICIPNKGCLNMGYVIRFYPKEDTRATYLIGGENKYEVLNKKAFSINDSENYRNMSTNDALGTRGTSRLNISNQSIVLKPNEEIDLFIAWEWAFETGDVSDDLLDTQIGEYASQIKDTLNDRYRFYLGFQFEVEDICAP